MWKSIFFGTMLEETLIQFTKVKKITNETHVERNFHKQETWRYTSINSVHNVQKDYKCDSCGKTFTTLGNLKRHINSVHNGQKDDKCDSCGKAFSQAADLKIHYNSVHNGQKDHKCNSFGKNFTQPGNLKKHINNFHNNQKHH